MNENLISITTEIIKTFIRIYSNQNEEECILFDNGEILKFINTATLEKMDRTINNKDFTFKYHADEKYAIFLSLKLNPNYGNKRSILKIKEKLLKINFDKPNDYNKDKNRQSKSKFDSYLDQFKKSSNSIKFNSIYNNNIENENEQANLHKKNNSNERYNDDKHQISQTNYNLKQTNFQNNNLNGINENNINNLNKNINKDADISIVNIEFQNNIQVESNNLNLSDKNEVDLIQIIDEEINEGFQFNKELNFNDKNISQIYFEENEFFLNSKIYDFNTIKNEEKNMHRKFLSDYNIPTNIINNSSNYDATFNNITDYIIHYNKQKQEKQENPYFISPDDILNFECEKYLYFLSFIQVNQDVILPINLQKDLSVENYSKIFKEKLKNINYLSDIKQEDDLYEILKEIFINLKIKFRILLNREFTFFNHTNKETFRYFYVKNIKVIGDDILEFERKIDKRPILDIEIRKFDREQKVIEDGVLLVVFLICNDLHQLVELFSKIKYEVYYSKFAITNYICKYVHDIVFEYTHISENFLEFFKNFGFVETDNYNKRKDAKNKILDEENLSLKKNNSEYRINPTSFSEKKNNAILLTLKNDSIASSLETEANVNCVNRDLNSNEYNNLKKKCIQKDSKFHNEEVIDGIEFISKNIENIPIKNESNYDDQVLEIIFPFKKMIKDLNELINFNLLRYINKNLTSIKMNNNINTIPFPKFLKLLFKYNCVYMNEDGIRMKHSFLKKPEYSKFRVFKKFLIFDKSDKITKDHKLDVNKLIRFFLEEIEENFIITDIKFISNDDFSESNLKKQNSDNCLNKINDNFINEDTNFKRRKSSNTFLIKNIEMLNKLDSHSDSNSLSLIYVLFDYL